MNPARTWGMAAALGSATLYGINVPFARLAGDAGLNGPDLVFYRVLAMLAVVGLAASLLRRSLVVPPGERLRLAILSLVTAGVGLAYISAIAFVPVGIAVIVFFTFPCVILIVSPLVDRERITVSRVAAFALSFAGLVIAIGPAFGTFDWRGLALAALASVLAAAQFLIAARAGRTLNPVSLVLWTHIGILPVALGIAMLVGGPVAPAALWIALIPFAANTLAYIVGFFLHMRAVALAPPALIGLIYTLEPVVTVATAAVLLGERLSTPQYIGGALVLAALVLAVAVETRPTGQA
jgi:drug/metabolite transporter (DMT)-like permease